MGWIAGLRGVLLDVDGTLLHGDRAVEGAADAVARLRRAGLRLRWVTNTTRRSRAAVAATLVRAGIDVAADEVVAPSILAKRRILDSGRTRVGLLVAGAAREDFAGLREVEDRPDWVVVGDLGRAFDWEVLNRAFRWLHGGARLLALQKNRFWADGNRGLVLDAGAFVAGLEFAAGVTAEVLGKPSAEFYRLALDLLGLPASDTLMVGDDPDSDGRGASAAGCRTCLVRTGKFSEGLLRDSGYRPDLLLDSVAGLETE